MSSWSQSLVSSRLQYTVIFLLVNDGPCVKETNNKAEDALGDDESEKVKRRAAQSEMNVSHSALCLM